MSFRERSSFPKYLIFVPAGPNADPEFIGDTIDSVLFALGPEANIVVGDDSGTSKFECLAGRGPNVFVRKVPIVPGLETGHSTSGSLFVKKAQTYKLLVQEFDFDRLLNLDDDALMLNSKVIDVAESLFDRRKDAGVLGRYVLDHEFQPVSFETQLEQMRAQISRNPFRNPKFVNPLRQPAIRTVLRPLMLRAIENGYTMGTAFIGGSCLFTRECLQRIVNLEEINNPIFQYSPSGEDDMFTICCFACGYRVYDLLHDPPIFHVAWRKLTMSPQELHDMGASVIHSVRDPAHGGEAKIREFFREKRSGSQHV
jgi:hypothetical protein